jgi:hypothetical protein
MTNTIFTAALPAIVTSIQFLPKQLAIWDRQVDACIEHNKPSQAQVRSSSLLNSFAKFMVDN